MTYGRLVLRNLFRHPLRSLFTTLSIALSIFLVCAVLSLPSALTAILDKATSNTRLSSRSSVRISTALFASRSPVGSSATSRSGSVTIARAIATRCCSPPESSDGR